MTFLSDAKLMCVQNCPPSLRGAVRSCGGGCRSGVGGLWLGVVVNMVVMMMNTMMVAEVGSYVRGYVEVPC